MSFEEIFREHWRKGAFFLGSLAFELVVAFEKHLADLTLAARFFLVGVCGFVAVWSVAEMLVFERERSVGFDSGTENKPSRVGILIRALTILAVCAFSAFIFGKTATFHNVCVTQKAYTANPTVGTVEIQPPHAPVDLTVLVSTPQPDVKIIQEAPASWNAEDPVDWRMQNESSFGEPLYWRASEVPRFSAFGTVFQDAPTI